MNYKTRVSTYITLEREMDDDGNCVACGSKMILAPGIDYYCSNEDCARDSIRRALRKQSKTVPLELPMYRSEAKLLLDLLQNHPSEELASLTEAVQDMVQREGIE